MRCIISAVKVAGDVDMKICHVHAMRFLKILAHGERTGRYDGE
jgi:hypothetical protein